MEAWMYHDVPRALQSIWLGVLASDAPELLAYSLHDERLDRHVRVDAVVRQWPVDVVLQPEADPLPLPPASGRDRPAPLRHIPSPGVDCNTLIRKIRAGEQGRAGRTLQRQRRAAAAGQAGSSLRPRQHRRPVLRAA